MLVNYGRSKHGADFWTKWQEIPALKGLFYPFQSTIKRYTGKDYKTFTTEAGVIQNYHAAGNRMKERHQEEKTLFSRSIKICDGLYVSYMPARIHWSTSNRYRHLPAFYIRIKSGEHQLEVQRYFCWFILQLPQRKNWYTAYESDPHAGAGGLQVIRMFDVQTREQRSLKTKTKYFTPDISADGTKIVAASGHDGKSSVDVPNSSNGEVINTLQSAEVGLFTDPKFMDDNRIVTAVRLTNGKCHWSWQKLLPVSLPDSYLLLIM